MKNYKIIINILVLVVLINCKIASTTSEAVNQMETISSSSTEGLDMVTKAGKTTTDGTKVDLPPDVMDSDDDDLLIVNFSPKSLTTSAPDALGSDENVQKATLGRKKNYRIRPNCRCVILNRCAKTEVCLNKSKLID